MSSSFLRARPSFSRLQGSTQAGFRRFNSSSTRPLPPRSKPSSPSTLVRKHLPPQSPRDDSPSTSLPPSLHRPSNPTTVLSSNDARNNETFTSSLSDPPRLVKTGSPITKPLSTSLNSLPSHLPPRPSSSSSPSKPSKNWKELLKRFGSLELKRPKMETRRLATLLVNLAATPEERVEVASVVFRRSGANTLLVYETAHRLLHIFTASQPLPHPKALLQFLVTHRARIRLAFSPTGHPLPILVEIYSRVHTQDQKRLDSAAAAPPPASLAELGSLRLQHLDAVRAIHQAMKEVDKDVFTVRSYTSLMEAYARGKAFKQVEEVWQLMRSQGGVGINERAVSVYFDACGFSGQLHSALVAWKGLRSAGLVLEPNTYLSFHECLTRCGAWDELVHYLAEQQNQHLLHPSTTPPLNPASIAIAANTGRRIVSHPRHRSLRDVNWDAYDRLMRRMKGVVPEETWVEAERLWNERNRWDKVFEVKPEAFKVWE